MLATLCQLSVVLVSLFRVVWDFLEGCLGFFTESSVLSSKGWASKRCFSLFTCQRVKGRVNTRLLFHIIGGLGWRHSERRRRGRRKEMTECALSHGATLGMQREGSKPVLSPGWDGFAFDPLFKNSEMLHVRHSWIESQKVLPRQPMRDKIDLQPHRASGHDPKYLFTAMQCLRWRLLFALIRIFAGVGMHPGSTGWVWNSLSSPVFAM